MGQRQITPLEISEIQIWECDRCGATALTLDYLPGWKSVTEDGQWVECPIDELLCPTCLKGRE
jgi:ribosomal protein L37AE/L43A